MKPLLIDGKFVAEELRKGLKKAVEQLKSAKGVTPGLAVILVGDDPASAVYVRNKSRQTIEIGMNSFEHRMSAETEENELLDLIDSLNCDPSVHGILVQLPLPKQIDERRVIEAIDPAKDVDGFHPVNVGRLYTGQATLVPCTPLGCVKLIKTIQSDLGGLNAVIVGRSNIVGKPVAQLLLAENCTVTIAHSRTSDLTSVCQAADILVVAVGRANLVKGHWIKPGAIVIDVGINRVIDRAGKGRLVGDVEFESASKVAGSITPVPGGVGPMTIACLLANTLEAAHRIEA